jgi:hypothetical protein
MVIEDGRPLGPAHSFHDTIRNQGRGRFSHWHSGLYFSTSDGSDPRANGRVYELKARVKMSPWIAAVLLAVGALPLLLRYRQLARRVGDPRVESLQRIGAATIPVVAIALLILVCFRLSGGKELFLRPPSIEHTIVDAQLARMREATPQVAFVGDSSCLMGVDAPVLSRSLGARIENFCTIGYVGPAGYAHMVDELSKRLPPTGAIVVMIHGVQLVRDPSWESWAEYVKTEGVSARLPAPFLTASRYLAWHALDPLVFSVLPGTYGRHYGGEHALFRAVQDGDVVDPSDRNMNKPAIVPPFVADPGLAVPVDAPVPENMPNGFRYKPGASFLAATPMLRDALARSGRRAYLVLSPIPGNVEDRTTREQRTQIIGELPGLLGIPPSQVLAMPSTMPPEVSASTTHLAPRGRAIYTTLLAKALAESRVAQ